MSIILCIALFPAAISAQTLLNVPGDARSLATGGSDIAMGTTPFSVVSNPAAIVQSDRTFSVALNYMMFQPSVNMNHLPGVAAYYKINQKWGVSLNARYFSHPVYDCSGDNGIVLGTVSPYELAVSAGISYQIIDGLSVGANLGYFGSNMGNPKIMEGYNNGGAFMADVSLMYSISGFSAVLAVTNLGTDIYHGAAYGLTGMPAAGRIGVAYDCMLGEKNRLSFSLQGDILMDSGNTNLGIGAEYSYSENVFVRCGYHYGIGMLSIPSYFSVGAGCKFAGISLSAAYLVADKASALLNTFNITLGYEF